MMFGLFSVFDKAAESYAIPTAFPNANVASRSFSDYVMSGENDMIARHPGDYELHEIGAFDDETGLLYPSPTPSVLLTAEAVLRQKSTPELVEENA